MCSSHFITLTLILFHNLQHLAKVKMRLKDQRIGQWSAWEDTEKQASLLNNGEESGRTQMAP